MKTVNDIKNGLTEKEMTCPEGILSIRDMIELSTSNKLFRLFGDNSHPVSLGGKSGKGQEIGSKYEIDSPELIDTLRNLWATTKNAFAKSVIETVGASKSFTDKQLRVITNELSKFDTIELI